MLNQLTEMNLDPPVEAVKVVEDEDENACPQTDGLLFVAVTQRIEKSPHHGLVYIWIFFQHVQ